MHPKLSCLPLFALVVLNLLACGAFATENAQATFGKPSIDLVVVIKSTRTMYLYADGIVVKRFPVSLGAHPVGDKHESGDERTPEGHYILDWRNPDSLYHLSIHISYPNARVIAWARAHGVDP